MIPVTRTTRSSPDARISLFVGKGGVGKSTLATATAVRDARAGLRVLIVSTDQAHSIGDVLGTAVTPTGLREPTRVLADDAGRRRRLPRRARPGHAGAAGGAVAGDRRPAFRPISRIGSGRHCARRTFGTARHPGGARPARGRRAGRLGAVGPRRGGLRVDRRRAADAHAARDVRPVPGARLAAASPAVHGRRRRPHRRPSSRCSNASAPGPSSWAHCSPTVERVSAHLVMTAERVVAAEAVRTLGSLALMGVRVDELIVNQILVQDDSYEYRNLPEHPAFDWYSERISEQQAVLDELDTTIGDVQLVLVPHLAGEPIGPKALGELLDSARRRDGSPPPGPLRPDRRPRIGSWTRSGLPVAARVAAGRLRRADVGPGRRRLDHRRRRYAAPGSAGVRPAAMHRDGCAAARQ